MLFTKRQICTVKFVIDIVNLVKKMGERLFLSKNSVFRGVTCRRGDAIAEFVAHSVYY